MTPRERVKLLSELGTPYCQILSTDLRSLLEELETTEKRLEMTGYITIWCRNCQLNMEINLAVDTKIEYCPRCGAKLKED